MDAEAPSGLRRSGASTASAETVQDDAIVGLARHTGSSLTASRKSLAVVEKRQDRWEVEVANGVGSNQSRVQTLKERRNFRCSSMKSADDYVKESIETGGTGVYPEQSEAAIDRARKRRLEQKKEALAAEAAKMAERAAKMAAKRTKAKQVRQRHELRLQAAEERKLALEVQAEDDKKVLDDIQARRAELHRKLAEDETKGDIECVLQWALPAPWREAASRPQEIRDEAVVRRLMGKNGVEDDTVKLSGKGGDVIQAVRDDEAFRFILENAATHDEARSNAAALRTLVGLEHIADPMTGATRLVRPQAKVKTVGGVAQAARDVRVLNGIVNESAKNTIHSPRVDPEQIQAWKDVGAISMLMQGVPGIESRRRVCQAEKDEAVVQALMGTRIMAPTEQDLADSEALERLLGVSSTLSRQDNLLQPLGVHAARDDGVLRRLIGEQATCTPTTEADDKIIQRLLAPGNGALPPSGFNSNMSPYGGCYQDLPSASNTAAYRGSMRDFLGHTAQQDVLAINNLMGSVPAISDAQTLRDIDALNRLLR